MEQPAIRFVLPLEDDEKKIEFAYDPVKDMYISDDKGLKIQVEAQKKGIGLRYLMRYATEFYKEYESIILGLFENKYEEKRKEQQESYESGYHDSKLIIAGKGGMIDELRDEVRRLGIENKVYFTGYLNLSQVTKMYKCADVAVFPSTYEPFGVVALEGMLSGTPVVVSDVGGLNEIVQHRENGMKSYAGNPNSIADSILELLYNPGLCAEVSRAAKAKVKAQYNWTKIAQDTHFIYQKAICQTMAEKQRRELEQEKAKKTKKAKNTQGEITNLLSFKKRHAYA